MIYEVNLFRFSTVLNCGVSQTLYLPTGTFPVLDRSSIFHRNYMFLLRDNTGGTHCALPGWRLAQNNRMDHTLNSESPVSVEKKIACPPKNNVFFGQNLVDR